MINSYEQSLTRVQRRRKSLPIMHNDDIMSSNASVVNETNPFCKYLLPRKQFWIGFQHKTGHIIGQHLFKYLSEYCQYSHFSHAIAMELDNKPQKVFKLFNRAYTRKDEASIYQFIREPLNTIVSGFNYWKHGKEGWTRGKNFKSLHHDRRFIKFEYDTNTTYNPRQNSTTLTLEPYNCFLDRYIFESNFPFPFNVTDFEFAFDVNDSIYGIHWLAANNYSLSEWYQYLDEHNRSIAMFEEFKRYFLCEFNDKYAIYQLVKLYHGENNKYHMFWNDDFRHNFDENVNRFLDSINFIASEQSDQILRMNGIKDFNITKERHKLFELMEPLRHNKQHSAGHFDERNDQIHALLSLNNYTCLTIKKMTLMISAPWNHPTYC